MAGSGLEKPRMMKHTAKFATIRCFVSCVIAALFMNQTNPDKTLT